MANNPVVWFEIYVDDMKRAQDFYETVLKVKLESIDSPDGTDLQMLMFPGQPDSPGASGSLVKVEGVAAGGNSTLVYFGCEDCATEAARVAVAGGKVEREKMSIGDHGFIALAFDTEGNMFGLHSLK